MTQLKGVIKRSVKIYGIVGMVNMTLSEEGLKFAIPGTKQQVMIDLPSVIKHCSTPTNVPSYLFGDPFGLLKANALNQQQKAQKKEDK